MIVEKQFRESAEPVLAEAAAPAPRLFVLEASIPGAGEGPGPQADFALTPLPWRYCALSMFAASALCYAVVYWAAATIF